jgi:hypothetical protein
MAREYNNSDIRQNIRVQVSKAMEAQDFKKAERLEQWLKWYEGGCVGREPQIPLRKMSYKQFCQKFPQTSLNPKKIKEIAKANYIKITDLHNVIDDAKADGRL